MAYEMSVSDWFIVFVFFFKQKTAYEMSVSDWFRRVLFRSSLLDIALGAGVDLEHACGGVCACSTCHVIVKAGLESCNEGTDDEFDQLDEAPAITLQSRLGCQC